MENDAFWALIWQGRREWGCQAMQILQIFLWIQSRHAPPSGVRRILRAAPTAAGPCSRDAWFLVILCLIYPLKCVLARLFLVVNFQVICLSIIIILDTDRHGAPLWHPGGPWDDPGTVGRTPKDTLGSRLGFLLIFGGFRVLILRAFRGP